MKYNARAQLQKLFVIVAHNGQFDVDMLNRKGLYPPRVISFARIISDLATDFG